MRINGSDTATVRLFAIDLPPDSVDRFVTEAGTGEWPLRATLGASTLRDTFVDVVRIADLGEMRLSDYLVEAHGVIAGDIADMRSQVDALDGHVVILPSQAFGGASQELTVAAPLRWIGTFGGVRPRTKAPKLRSTSAQGAAGAARPVSDAAMSGRVATIALLVLFALTAILIWVAS